MKTTLLVLAAGMGNRYGGLKQLDAAGPSSESIMEYSLFDAIEAGFNKIVFVIRKSFVEEFKVKIANKLPKNIEVEFTFQEIESLPDFRFINTNRQKPWGTGHAVLMAKEKINEPFGVINADDFYGKNSFKQLHGFLNQQKTESSFCMVGFELQKTLSLNGSVSRGICNIDKNNLLTDIEEFTKISETNNGIEDSNSRRAFNGNEIVSLNMWGMSPFIFKYLESDFNNFLEHHSNDESKEFFLPTAINRLIENKIIDLHVLKTNDSWFGITYKEDKQLAIDNVNNLTSKGLYPQKLWN